MRAVGVQQQPRSTAAAAAGRPAPQQAPPTRCGKAGPACRSGGACSAPRPAHSTSSSSSSSIRLACRAGLQQQALVQEEEQQQPGVLGTQEQRVYKFGFRPGFDYEFDRGPMIGSGSFGVVHVARHIASGHKYAVKSIPKVYSTDANDYSLDPGFVARVFHEVDIARVMGQSLSVIHLLEAYEDDVSVELVMELAAGGSLWGRIQRGPVPEAEAARLIADVLRAVAQCHAKGVVIRDVKPDNFLFISRRSGSPLKMVDFGLAQKLARGQLLTERAGTPFYVSPDVLAQSYAFPTDVWSAGITSYQLLTGRLPWANDAAWVSEVAAGNAGLSGYGASTAARLGSPGGGANIPGGVLWDAITSAELDFTWLSWDGISGGARDIVRAMLERDPQQRPTAAQLLQHPWLSGAQECAACWGARRPPPSADDCRACVQQQGAGTASSSSSSRGGAGGAGKQQQQQQQQPGAQEALESPGPPPHHPQQQQQQQAQQQQAQRDGQAPAHVPLYLRPLEDSLVQRLQRYGTFSRLKQVALRRITAVMMTLDASQRPPCVASYGAAFARLDAGASGTVPAARLAALLASDLWDLSDVEINMLVSGFDLNHDASVDMSEWLTALIDWPLAQEHPMWPLWLRQVFDAFDVDGDSVISSAELVAQLGGAAQLGWSELGGGAVEAAGAPAALRCLLRQADTDGDGVISFEEFASVVETHEADSLSLFPSRRCAGGMQQLVLQSVTD